MRWRSFNRLLGARVVLIARKIGEGSKRVPECVDAYLVGVGAALRLMSAIGFAVPLAG